MLRITSGSAKNRKLQVPDIPDFKPSQDKFRQALFSIIGDKVAEAECLDLYAGSGVFGLEALSRGAKSCDFVENARPAADAIIANIKTVGFDDEVDVFFADAVKYAAKTERRYDIVFVDPYYENVSHKHLFKNLQNILNENGLIAFSHGKDLDVQSLIVDTDLKIVTQRKFGAAHLTILGK